MYYLDVATLSLAFYVLMMPDSLDFKPKSHGAYESMEDLQILPCLATRKGLLPAHQHFSYGTYILSQIKVPLIIAFARL